MTINIIINAQEWLDNKYPDKTSVKEIELEVTDNNAVNNPSTTPSLEGDLKITDYPNLKKVKILHKKNNSSYGLKIWNEVDMGKVTINSCPNLTEIDLKFMKAKEIDFQGNFENLKQAKLIGNKLTELCVGNLTNLRVLNIGGNIGNVPAKLKGLEKLAAIR